MKNEVAGTTRDGLAEKNQIFTKRAEEETEQANGISKEQAHCSVNEQGVRALRTSALKRMQTAAVEREGRSKLFWIIHRWEKKVMKKRFVSLVKRQCTQVEVKPKVVDSMDEPQMDDACMEGQEDDENDAGKFGRRLYTVREK